MEVLASSPGSKAAIKKHSNSKSESWVAVMQNINSRRRWPGGSATAKLQNLAPNAGGQFCIPCSFLLSHRGLYENTRLLLACWPLRTCTHLHTHTHAKGKPQFDILALWLGNNKRRERAGRKTKAHKEIAGYPLLGAWFPPRRRESEPSCKLAGSKLSRSRLPALPHLPKLVSAQGKPAHERAEWCAVSCARSHLT